MDENEEVLYVSEGVMEYPLGFVVDAGGSVVKVIYRSTKDYSKGKPLKSNSNSGSGVLHLRTFDMTQIGDVFNFLKENCDVIVEDDDVEWWMTGVTTQHFKKKLDSSFNIRTKLFSEMLGLNNFFRNLDQLNVGCYDTDLKALAWATSIARFYIKVFKDMESLENSSVSYKTEEGISSNTKLTGYFNTFRPDCPCFKLFSSDLKDWSKQYLDYSGKLEYPSLLVHLGSSVPIGLITEDDPLTIVDFMSGFGKMLCGLSEELTKEPNFDKFMKMAERGNLEHVDLSTNDLKCDEHDEDDWYRPMLGNNVAFELGKLSSSNITGKGNYNKDDLAIGILVAMLKVISKISFLNARLNKVKSIIFTGSLPKYGLVRHHLMKNMMLEMIINNLTGMDLVKIRVLEHSGFACSLGVWMENVEKQKLRKHQQQTTTTNNNNN